MQRRRNKNWDHQYFSMNKQTSWVLNFKLCEPEPESVFTYVKLTLEIKQLFYQQSPLFFFQE